jgi:hypothetical protein
MYSYSIHLKSLLVQVVIPPILLYLLPRLVAVPVPLPYHHHYNDLRGFQALETFDETLAGTDHREVETTHVAFLTNMRNEQPP